MKLHLPKQLFTALLASLFAAIAPFTQAAEMEFSINRDTDNNITYNFGEDVDTGITMTYKDWTYSGGGNNNVGGWQSPKNSAYQNTFSPDAQLRSGQTDDSWTMNFTLDFSGLNESCADDTEVDGVVITGFSFDAYAINGGGTDKTANIPVTATIKAGASSEVSSSVSLAYGGSTTEIVLNLADPISYSAENSPLDCSFSLSDAKNYNTYTGLTGGSVLYAYVLSSTTDVTWIGENGVKWSGANWQTASGKQGVLASAYNAAATFSGTGDCTVTVDAAATAGSITVSGGNYTFAVGSYTVDESETAGTLNITGDVTVSDGASATFNVDTTVGGKLYANGGNITLGDGTNSGTLTVNRVEVADAPSGQSTFTVESNYTLKVTGDANTIQNDTSQYKTNSFVVSEWANSTTMNVKGTILAENAAVMTGDSGVTINIENGGTLATKGLGRSNPGKTAVSTVNLKDGGTLVLGDMGMDYDGKVTANISGGKIGIAADTVTIADALNITGNLSVDTTQYSYGESGLTQGTTGGKIVFGGDLTGGGTLTASGAGSLEFGAISSGVSISTGTAGVNFTGTLAMGDGTTFTVGSGSFSVDASNLDNYSVQAGSSIVDKDGNTATNGFAAGARAVIDGGTIDGEFTVTYDGETFTINNENRTFGPADYIDLGTWYITSGNSTLSEIYAQSSSAAISAAGGTTLNVDATLSTGLELTGNATMNISQDTTLAASAITTNGNKVTLDGSGTYSINRGNATNVAVAEGWTGLVELFGQGSSSSHAALDLTSYGRSGSTISIKEYVGYFSNNGNGTKNIDANLVLTNTNLAAIELLEGYTGGTYNFNGSVSGDGNFIVGKDLGAGKSMTFNFTGDTSGWTGQMVVTCGEHNVKYSGSKAIKNSNILARSGKGGVMNLTIEHASSEVTVDSTITGNETNNTVNLTTNAAQGVSFNENVNVAKLAVANGTTAKINAAGKTITAGKVQISQQDATLSNVTVQDSSISATATDGTKGSISNALVQLQEDASFTIQDMTLTNTSITAASSETRVNLQNVEASNVVLAKGKFSTDAPMSVVGAGGTAFSASTSAITEGSSITINASAGASLAVDLGDLSCVTAMGPGKYDLSITLSGVTLDSYTGLEDGAGITFEGWLGELIGASSDVQVSFSEAVAEETPAAVAEGGAATGVTYSTGSVGTVITITGLNVPEPTTATLSLLALAALAARRRRND